MFILFRGQKHIPDGILGSQHVTLVEKRSKGRKIQPLLTNTIPGGGYQCNDFWAGQNPGDLANGGVTETDDDTPVSSTIRGCFT